MEPLAMGHQIVLFAKVIGTIVRECVTAPFSESCILICETGRVTTQRARHHPLNSSGAEAAWTAAGREVVATGRA